MKKAVQKKSERPFLCLVISEKPYAGCSFHTLPDKSASLISTHHSFIVVRRGISIAKPATAEPCALQPLPNSRVFLHDVPDKTTAPIFQHEQNWPLIDAEIGGV